MFVLGMFVGITIFLLGFVVGIKRNALLNYFKIAQDNPYMAKDGLLSYKHAKFFLEENRGDDE